MEANQQSYPAGMTRREFLRLVGLTGAAAALYACAPEAPVPPGPGSGAGAGAATGAGWEAEWERVLAAAIKEGTLSLVTPTGAGMRRVVEAFQAQFPQIQVEHTPSRTSDFAAKASKEQQAGIYSIDVAIVSMASVIRVLKPIGGVEPIRPIIFRGDVVDDKYWLNGFEDGFWSLDKQLFYASGIEAADRLWINTDVVREGEVRTFKDLLDPKWKGKVAMMDPRTEGAGYLPMSAIRYTLGRDGDQFLTEFFTKQEPALMTNDRVFTEAMVRGTYPIGISVYDNILTDFQRQGLGRSIKLVPKSEFAYLQDPVTPMWLVAKAPHPNAAKLFVNWYLTKEGQTIVSKEMQANSRRTDVPPQSPETMPEPGRTYWNSQKEESLQHIDETIALMKRVIRA